MTLRARRLVLPLITLAVMAVAAPTSSAQLPRFHGHVGGAATGSGHMFYEGDGLNLVFTDSYRSDTRYRVCWATTGGDRRSCWRDQTDHYGQRSRIFVSAPRAGSYIARWYVRGRVVDSWSFTIGLGD
jgi:hypothetical protein